MDPDTGLPRRVHAQEWLTLGVLLSAIHGLWHKPDATFSRVICPNCGDELPMLQESLSTGQTLLTCSQCQHSEVR